MSVTLVQTCGTCHREIRPDEAPHTHNGIVLCQRCWSDQNRTPAPISSAPSALDGWLFLPAVGLVLAPLGALAAAGHIQGAVASLRDQALISSFSGAVTLEKFAVTSAVMLAGVHLVAAVFFFQKRRFVPQMMVGLYVLDLGYGLILTAAEASVFPLTLSPRWLFGLMLSLGWTGLWIVYFLQSSRVRATFVR